MQVNFINEAGILLKSSMASKIVIPIKDSRITIEYVTYTVSEISYNYDLGIIGIHITLFYI